MKRCNLSTVGLLVGLISLFLVPGWTSFPDQTTPSIEAQQSQTQVVVLVHGFQPNDNGGTYACDTGITQYDPAGDPDALGYYMLQDGEGIPKWLHEAGFEVWFAHYDTDGPRATGTPEDNAACLADQIAQVRGNDSNGKVVLIGHSLGGIVSRYYLEGEATDRPFVEDVEILFTLGSPHKGVPITAILQVFGDFCENNPGACALTVDHMKDFNKNHDRAPGVAYYLIGGDAPLSYLKPLNKALSALLVGDNDGLIKVASALGKRLFPLDYKLDGVTGRLETDEVHAIAHGVNSYPVLREDGSRSRAYLECIEPVLTGGTPGCD